MPGRSVPVLAQHDAEASVLTYQSVQAYALLVLASRREYVHVKDVDLNERYRMAGNARSTHMLFWWCAASSLRNAVVFTCNTLIGWYFMPR